MIRVGVVGATGYTAVELLRLLARHPGITVTAVTSRDPDQPALSAVHPQLQNLYDLQVRLLDLESFCEQVDVAFCCLPHAASAEVVTELVQRDVRVIDFSADYRLNDVATFESWYGVSHPDPDRVGQVPYGIPELFRDQIQDARLVANPGCFPSSALLALVPVLSGNLIEPAGIIVDSKTGVSGAGRKPSLKFHFPECNESVVAYGGGRHRHMPEIDQIIQRKLGTTTDVIFTPHLVAMDRGILSTIYVRPRSGVNAEQVNAALSEYYRKETFVRVMAQPPTTRDVARSNYCDLFAFDCRGMVVITSALDNLVKGASGAAVQNFNRMLGFDEATALI